MQGKFNLYDFSHGMHYSISLTCFSHKRLVECVLTEEEAIFDTNDQGVLDIRMGIAKKLISDTGKLLTHLHSI